MANDETSCLEKSGVASGNSVVGAEELGLGSINGRIVLGHAGKSGQSDDDSVLGGGVTDGLVVLHLSGPNLKQNGYESYVSIVALLIIRARYNPNK